MTTYRTGNAIGSADPRDLYDNAENLDEFVNSQDKAEHPDRLGVPRKTWHGMEEDFQSFLQSSGYQGLGDYAAGIEITARNQVIRADGELWRISASVELPYTTTGAGMPEGGAFVSVGDAVLRQELADGTASVTSATGNQTLAEALDDRAIRAYTGITVESIVDLLDRPVSDLSDGDQAVVVGYYSGSAYGGGRFQWDSSSTESPDDGIVFAPSPSEPGRWIRQHNNTISPMDFGCIGDGEADDLIRFKACFSAVHPGMTVRGNGLNYNLPQSDEFNTQPIVTLTEAKSITIDFSNSEIYSADEVNTSVPALFWLEDCEDINIDVLLFERIRVPQETAEHDGDVVRPTGSCKRITLNKKIGKKGKIRYGEGLMGSFWRMDGSDFKYCEDLEVYGHADQSKYGVRFRGVTNGSCDISTYRVKRSLYIYNVETIRAWVTSTQSTSNDIRIVQVSSDGPNSIRDVEVHSRHISPNWAPVRIASQVNGAVLDNIRIFSDISAARRGIYIQTNDDTTPDVTGVVIDNIQLSASFRGAGPDASGQLIAIQPNSGGSIGTVHLKDVHISNTAPNIDALRNTSSSGSVSRIQITNWYSRAGRVLLQRCSLLQINGMYVRARGMGQSENHITLSGSTYAGGDGLICFGTVSGITSAPYTDIQGATQTGLSL